MNLEDMNYLVIRFPKTIGKMSYAFPQDQVMIAFILGVFFSTTGFSIYYFLNRTGKNTTKTKHSIQANVKEVLFRRFSGISIYLIFPLLIYLLLTGENLLYQYTGQISRESFLWFLPLGIILIILNYINAGRGDNLGMYPEIRKKEWSLSLLFLSALSWTLYLFAYEFLFRGILFIPAVQLFGFWPAVIINIVFFLLLHVPKGIKEGIGSIFLGFVLCFLVVKTGSFWIAFFVHVTLALSSEWFSIYAHPEMKVVR